MTELADRTAQSRSRLSHQVSRMESRGLVVREGCEGDKRGTFAVLTEFGAETIGQVAPHHVASVRQHFIDQLAADGLGPSPTPASRCSTASANPRPRLGEGDRRSCGNRHRRAPSVSAVQCSTIHA